MVLTWGRIALIPLVVGVFMMPEGILSQTAQNILGCIFFIVAAITDALDGYIARKYAMGSKLGAFLDPVADKLMVSAALIVLLAFNRVDMFVALVIIGREITVTALREWMAKVGESGKVKVNVIGKIKTISQMVAIPMLLYYEKLLGIDMALVGTVLIYVAALLTLYSMFVYLKAAAPYFDKEPKN
jgi:CDP-diacylglycerol--glycerol-3-phosphate 3-phosphatidyltransferase